MTTDYRPQAAPLTLKMDTIVADLVRRYGYPADAIRHNLDAIREAFERVDETTIHPDHIDPIVAAEMIEAYDNMPHDFSDGDDDQ